MVAGAGVGLGLTARAGAGAGGGATGFPANPVAGFVLLTTADVSLLPNTPGCENILGATVDPIITPYLPPLRNSGRAELPLGLPCWKALVPVFRKRNEVRFSFSSGAATSE